MSPKGRGRISMFFHRLLFHNDLVELKELNKAREHQEKRLEEITRAALDGESGWFRKALREDPACVLRVLDSCDKETK